MLDRQLAINLFSNIQGCSIEYSDGLDFIELGRPTPSLKLTQSQLIKRFFSNNTLINVHFPVNTKFTSQSNLRLISQGISLSQITDFIHDSELLDNVSVLNLEDSSTYPGLFYLANSSSSLVPYVNSLKPGKYLAVIIRAGMPPIIARVKKIRNMPIINPTEVQIDTRMRIKINQWDFPFDYDLLTNEVKQFMQYVILDPDTNLSSQLPILL